MTCKIFANRRRNWEVGRSWGAWFAGKFNRRNLHILGVRYIACIDFSGSALGSAHAITLLKLRSLRQRYAYHRDNKKPKRLENSQLLRRTWQVNQIFELILEQCVANYYGDNTIAKWFLNFPRLIFFLLVPMLLPFKNCPMNIITRINQP